MAVTLEELVASLLEEMHAQMPGSRAELHTPRQWRDEVRAHLEHIDEVNLAGTETLSGEDTFILWGQEILTAHWIPGLTEAELEIYQQLRYDGVPSKQAEESVHALRVDET